MKKKFIIIKILAFFLLLLNSCNRSNNEPLPPYCLREYILGVTFVVSQNTGLPYNGAEPTERVIGELIFNADGTYTSTVSFLGNGNYEIQDEVDCKHGIKIKFINSGLTYQTYDDNLTIYQNNERFMSGMNMRNIYNSSDILMLGRKI